MNNDERHWKPIRKLLVPIIIILILKYIFHIDITDTAESIISVAVGLIRFVIRHPFISLLIALFIISAPNERENIEGTSNDNKFDYSTPADRYYKKHGFDIYYYNDLPRDKEFNEMDLAGYAMNKRFEENFDVEDEEDDYYDLW